VWLNRAACTSVLGAVLGCTSVAAPTQNPVPLIVFDWSVNGERSIFRAGLDGTDTVRLSSGGASDQHPSERDGIVVFTSYRDGHGEIYSVPATGGPLTRVTVTMANETQPALSPDTTKIAYVSDVSGVTKLWLCAIDGSGAHPLTAGFGFAGAPEASPSWAPDGTRLVFVSTTNGSANLFILTLVGGAPTPLVTGPSADVEPAWSPSGTEIAFASTQAGDGSTNIFTVDVATQQIVQVTHDAGTDGQPAWLTDGRIVYTTWVGGAAQLHWIDPLRSTDTGTGTGTVPVVGDAQHAAAIL